MQTMSSRDPLQSISRNSVHHTKSRLAAASDSAGTADDALICNENVDPSQLVHRQCIDFGIKLTMATAPKEVDPPPQCAAPSLSQRRAAPPLRVEVLSSGFPSANNGNQAALSSAASSSSFTTTNDAHFLPSSSVSASASASLSGYGSRSRSLCESEANALSKKRRRSLLRTVKDLVSKRRWRGSDGAADGDDLDSSAIITPLSGTTPRISKSTPLIPGKRASAAECLESMVGDDSLTEDFAASLFRDEEAAPWFFAEAPFNAAVDGKGRSVRRSVVDWVCSVGVRLELRRSTIYRAIFYFDGVCSAKRSVLRQSHLRVVAASCLLIAAKWNEAEQRVPTLRRLRRASHREYATTHSLKTTELAVLNALDFRLKVVIAIDFVEWAVTETGCVWPGDDSLVGADTLRRSDHTDSYLMKFAKFFLDIAVQSYSQWQWLPSIMAAAVLLASRRALNIAPYFNRRVTGILRTEPRAVRPCFDALWALYAVRFPGDAKKAQTVQPLLF